MKKNYKRYFQNILEIMKRPDMTVLPAQLAFFFLLSLVPTITIIFYLTSLLSLSFTDILIYLNIKLSDNLLEFIVPTINTIKFQPSIIILLLLGILIASNGTNSMIISANNIYGIKNKTFINRKIKAIIMILIIILLFIFILLVPLLGEFILKIIEKITGYNKIYSMISFLKLPFSWFVIFLFIKILYTIAPDKEIPSSSVNIGAIFTSFGWILSTQVYLYYVKNFANYSIFYSGLSNIVILMIWMYILATIFVIGMGLNYKEELHNREENITNNRNNKNVKD